MKYGDISTLVQLGVGLHVGAALLQLYGEIGVQPLVRTVMRIRDVVDREVEDQRSLVEELESVETAFDIFKIQLFNEYKLHIEVNSVVGCLLVGLLIYISYNVDAPLSLEASVVFVALAVLPAPISVGIVWYKASKKLKPLIQRARRLEEKTLKWRAP